MGGLYRLLISYKLSLRSLLNHRRRLQKQVLKTVMPEAQRLAWQRSSEQRKTVKPEHLPWSDIKALAEGRVDTAEYFDTLYKIGPMITTLNYILRWIELGGMPPPVADISRLSKEQRERMWLSKDANIIGKSIWQQRQSSLTEYEMELLKDLLSMLTDQERDVFVMVKGDGLTHDEVAEHLGMLRGNVYNVLKRVEEKFSVVRENQSKNERKLGQRQYIYEGEILLQRSLFE